MKNVSKPSLHRMARTNEAGALEEAIKAGADVNERDEFGTTPLHYSISERNHNITRLLVKHGVDVMVQDGEGFTALHYAAEYNACDIAEVLLEQNRDVLNIANKHGNQPLWTAVFNAQENYEIVDLLLGYGGDASHRNNSGLSPLDLAKRMGNSVLVERLNKSQEQR